MKKIYILALILISSYGLRSYFNFSDSVVTEKVPTNQQKVKKKRARRLRLPKITFEMPTQENLSPLTARLVGFTAEKFIDLNGLVWDLKKEALHEADFQAIVAFLKSSPQMRGAQLALHSFKNDLLTFVINDGRYHQETGSLMLEIINNPGQHVVMREYVLQYIPDYFAKNWLYVNGPLRAEKQLSGNDLLIQEAFISSLWNITESTTGNALAGTALLDLHKLSAEFSKINAAEIDQRTESILENSFMPDSSRMAAFSIASERNLTHLFTKAEEVLFSEDEGIVLRLAALHSASTMAPDQQFNKRLQEEFIDNKQAHRFLKRAAGEAIQKYRERK